MCGAPHEATATNCAKCGEPLRMKLPISDDELRSFRSQTYALATVWMLLTCVTGFAGLILAGHPDYAIRALGFACCAAAVGFGLCAILGFRLNARGCARGNWIWLFLIAVQVVTLPVPWFGLLCLIGPQGVLFALCFAQKVRITALQQRILAAGLPLTVRPGLPDRPVGSRE